MYRPELYKATRQAVLATLVEVMTGVSRLRSIGGETFTVNFKPHASTIEAFVYVDDELQGSCRIRLY